MKARRDRARIEAGADHELGTSRIVWPTRTDFVGCCAHRTERCDRHCDRDRRCGVCVGARRSRFPRVAERGFARGHRAVAVVGDGHAERRGGSAAFDVSNRRHRTENDRSDRLGIAPRGRCRRRHGCNMVTAMVAADTIKSAERSASVPPPDTEPGRDDYDRWLLRCALTEMAATWCRHYLVGRTTREAEEICRMATDEMMRRQDARR